MSQDLSNFRPRIILMIVSICCLPMAGAAGAACPSSIRFLDGPALFEPDFTANHPYVPFGLGSARICWKNGPQELTEVWVSNEGAPETLFSTQSSSTACATAPWIQSDRTYKFTLYRGTGRTTKCDITYSTGRTLKAPKSASGYGVFLYAQHDHSHAFIPVGNTGSMNICWYKSGVGDVDIWVQQEGSSSQTLFAWVEDDIGCQTAPWIQVGKTFGFYAYDHGEPPLAARGAAWVTGVDF